MSHQRHREMEIYPKNAFHVNQIDQEDHESYLDCNYASDAVNLTGDAMISQMNFVKNEY